MSKKQFLFSHISRRKTTDDLLFEFCYTATMAEQKEKQESAAEKRQLHIELIRQMVNLSTSGFGLVAALAWNSVIQELVNTYIKKWLPGGGGIISLLIYAVVVTAVAVLVTYNLSITLRHLQELRSNLKK